MATLYHPGAKGHVDSDHPFPVYVSGAGADAFGRGRVSEPHTLFDSKQLFDKLPLFWDDQEESGGSTSSTYSSARASTVLGVGATTAGKRTRQTFMCFNYQPGKSQQALLTGILNASGGGTGIVSHIGFGNANNGLYFVDDEGTVKVRVRSKVTGSVVNADVAQSSWNLDTLDGSGGSGVTLDFTKTQIFLIDFEWLGVGSIRFGFVVNGKIIYAHQVDNANVLDSVYMSTPNLPLCYQIENDGTGVASTLEAVCSTVISEGGETRTGNLQYVSTSGTHIDADAADTLYAVLGIRLKSTHNGAVIDIESISLLAETNDDFEWVLLFNPTVASTFTYSDKTNSHIQTAVGVTANTVTGGDYVTGGFASATIAENEAIPNARRLGNAINGTADELVLCVRPLSANANIQAAVTVRELS